MEAPTLTAAQRRLLDIIGRHSASEERRHPGSGGWTEAWDALDEWMGHMPLSFGLHNSNRTFAKIANMVESHPEHDSLVRPVRA